ncbi:hypothetical protein [Halomarina rubra]|uniref:Amphi-Trp domain-containing protein n=1 Tax=Halomarina rubra TaxID=2071873 RepID=A0ABD6B0S4_9EURY|nr:hypothetical protein [Halomarina rubra]
MTAEVASDDTAFTELPHDEQRAALDKAFEAQQGSAWADLGDDEQAETLAAIEQASEETWMADVWQGSEDIRTIPFEIRQLSAGDLDGLDEKLDLFRQAEAAEDEAELREVLGADPHETFEDLAEWINEFLADATTGKVFDARFWRDGETVVGSKTVQVPPGTDIQLLVEIWAYYSEEQERAQKFRHQ